MPVDSAIRLMDFGKDYICFPKFFGHEQLAYRPFLALQLAICQSRSLHCITRNDDVNQEDWAAANQWRLAYHSAVC